MLAEVKQNIVGKDHLVGFADKVFQDNTVSNKHMLGFVLLWAKQHCLCAFARQPTRVAGPPKLE